jgi:hypothetical protein
MYGMHDALMMPDRWRASPALLLLAMASGTCQAQDTGWSGRHDTDLNHTEFVLSPFTYHFSGREGHTNVLLVGASRVDVDGSLTGASLFRNSFGQPSAYAFVGHEYLEPWGIRSFYYAWTAGLIYGYKGEHKDEIKPNLAGFAPGLIPRLGYQVNRNVSVEVATLGFAALMFNLSFKVK